MKKKKNNEKEKTTLVKSRNRYFRKKTRKAFAISAHNKKVKK